MSKTSLGNTFLTSSGDITTDWLAEFETALRQRKNQQVWFLFQIAEHVLAGRRIMGNDTDDKAKDNFTLIQTLLSQYGYSAITNINGDNGVWLLTCPQGKTSMLLAGLKGNITPPRLRILTPV